MYVDAEPAIGRVPRLYDAPQRGRPLAHPEQPPAFDEAFGAMPVIDDLDLQRRRAPAYRDGRAGGRRMTGHVGEGLLHDAVTLSSTLVLCFFVAGQHSIWRGAGIPFLQLAKAVRLFCMSLDPVFRMGH